jgi:hypothetical protein
MPGTYLHEMTPPIGKLRVMHAVLVVPISVRAVLQ